jgi:excisionase family DNA binding protein
MDNSHTLERNMTIAQTESMLVDAKEAAALCGVGRTTWLTLASAGKTPAAVRLGRSVKWRRDELKAWIAAGCPVRQKWESIYSENNS